jgi:transglutaminase-like putative cysteine protease
VRTSAKALTREARSTKKRKALFPMLVRVGYDIQFHLPAQVAMVAMLNVHPSRDADLLEPDELKTEPVLNIDTFIDCLGNRCTRFVAPPGLLRLTNSTLVRCPDSPDAVKLDARENPVGDLPPEVLTYLLNSRYCEVDRISSFAAELFGNLRPGWSRVQAICDWVNAKVAFNYLHARPTKSALDVYTERVGVCRDFQHLAIAFCRALNIPARYATGYLGDIGVPYGGPMDFSAWFEVYLDQSWWTFDARHNVPRLGRILMATGRDASDVALSTSFGQANLSNFFVVTEEEQAQATQEWGQATQEQQSASPASVHSIR